MTKNYYGLVSGLQNLVVGKKDDLSPADFRDFLSAQLLPEDYYQLLLLYYKYDNQNFTEAYFKTNEFNSNGNLSEEELGGIFKNKYSEDIYFSVLLDKIDLEQNNLTRFELEHILTQHYYDFVAENGIDFLVRWSEFELTLQNLTVVYALRNLKIDDDNQFIKGGYFSGLELKRINVADLDRQYPHLKRKYEALEITDPIQRKLKVDQIKWDFLDENSFFQYFTIEKILAYTIKLNHLEVWKEIDNNEGSILLDNYVQQVNNELETLIQ
ncbi:MAG: hypothetical protein CL840_07040 [Crocinitomicaceae bacterium]|nr:hypothetical protein [Crocinitomicaceae bacterium]|tara:strand:+ start:3147 stop:3953 length:807 start_codon:yes stop_codon:yes gene_type:complete